jgi:chaperonin GroES
MVSRSSSKIVVLASMKGSSMNDLSNLNILFDRIIVKEVSTTNITKGGLVLPESAKDSIPALALRECIVQLTGPGKIGPDGNRIPCSVKAGDIVYINACSLAKIDIGDTQYAMANEEHVIAFKKMSA